MKGNIWMPMSYVTRLQQLSATCDFHNIDEAIRDQVVEKGIRFNFVTSPGDSTFHGICRESSAANFPG